MFRKNNTLLALVSQSLSFKSLIPQYKQTDDYRCGYFCAKALINTIGNQSTWGLSVELELSEKGVGQSNLVKTLRNRGVSASVRYDLNGDKLEKYTDKGKYIIVYHLKDEHWMVLCDMNDGWMRFYDPEDKYKLTHYNVIKKHLGEFGILCTNKKKL